MKLKIKIKESETHKKVISKCLLLLSVLRVFVLFCVFVLHGSFCHGAVTLDISTLFTPLFEHIFSLYSLIR